MANKKSNTANQETETKKVAPKKAAAKNEVFEPHQQHKEVVRDAPTAAGKRPATLADGTIPSYTTGKAATTADGSQDQE